MEGKEPFRTVTRWTWGSQLRERTLPPLNRTFTAFPITKALPWQAAGPRGPCNRANFPFRKPSEQIPIAHPSILESTAADLLLVS